MREEDSVRLEVEDAIRAFGARLEPEHAEAATGCVMAGLLLLFGILLLGWLW